MKSLIGKGFRRIFAYTKFCTMEKKEIINEDTLISSPYRRTVKFNAARFTNTAQFRQSEGIMLNVDYLIDQQQNCKIFRSLNNSQMIMFLSYRALQLFNWIALVIEKDKDYVQLNESLFCKRANLKDKRTYQTAIKELIKYQLIISTHYDTVFWVNPEYLYNGDRLKKYRANTSIKDI